METQISEEDLLSGIELLPNSQPGTPINTLLRDTSVLSGLDDSISPYKESTTKSPYKSIDQASISASVQKVQNFLQESLASSLRKEVEIKSSWQSSPGEIMGKTMHFMAPTKENLGANSVSTTGNVLQKRNFLSLPHENKPLTTDAESVDEANNSINGPNVCHSSEFPSVLSPIKRGLSPVKERHVKLEKPVDESVLNDDQTKRLLDFMKQLERGQDKEKSASDQLASLYSLLKTDIATSGLNSEDKLNSSHNLTATQSNPQSRENNTGSENSTKVKPRATSKQTTQLSTRALPQKQTRAPGDKSRLSKQGKLSGKAVQFSVQEKQQAGLGQNLGKPTSKMDVKKTHGATTGKPKPTKGKGKTAQVSIQQKEPEPQLSQAVMDMMSVRDHLQTMLDPKKIEPLVLNSSGQDTSGFNITSESKEDTFRSTDTATLLRVQPSELVPVVSPPKQLTESLTTDLFSILKSGKTTGSDSARSSIDSSIAAENGILRDTLEKERYRRKHCEKQIQKLQKKMLETQQELAVASSTERKKDLMIEQLDKTLAKVVDGWKEHETSLGTTISQLTQEKEACMEDTVRLKEMVVNLENELAKVLEELVEEKEKIVSLQEEENTSKKNYQSRTEEISKVIDQKNETIKNLQAQNNELLEIRNNFKAETEKHEELSEKQKREFIKKEEEWEECIIELEKKHKEELEKEKANVENERKRCSEFQGTLSTTLQETRRLEDLLEAQRRELESMRTQASLVETRHAATIRKMEAEHNINVERQVSDKLAKVHQEAQDNENAIRESHKNQVLEFIDGHKREMESQCRRYEDELQKREASARETMAAKERELNDKLKTKSENLRQLMMSKMQNLLQAHYNETLQIVGTTTGETPQRPPVISGSPGANWHRENDAFSSSVLAHTLTRSGSAQHTDMLHSLRQSQLTGALPTPSLQSDSHPSVPSSYALEPIVSQAPKTAHHLASPHPQMTSNSSAITSSYHSFPSLSSHAFVPLQSSDLANRATQLCDDTEDDCDALPNLSLISSISQSTVASVQQSGHQHQQRQRFIPNLPAFTVPSKTAVSDAQKLGEGRLSAEQEASFPIEAVAGANHGQHPATCHDVTDLEGESGGQGDNRDKQLQHYISMLLERPPGDPLNMSRTSQLAGSQHQHGAKEGEDKENRRMAGGDPSGVPTSLALMQLFNQQANAGTSDLVPVKQDKVPAVPASRPPALVSRSPVKQKAGKAANQSKRARHSVRFATDPTTTGSTAPPSVQTPPVAATVFSPAQMGEISRMLGLYSASDTPTGETRVAAEQLLHYLRDKQAPVGVNSSIRPNETSSPLGSANTSAAAKTTKEQLEKQIPSAFRDATSNAITKERRTGELSLSRSPGKPPLPAWR